MESPPNCFINRAESGLVVTGDQKLELRCELKKILPHESCSDLVAACQGLDLALSPPPAFLSFNCGDKTCAAQPR
jgi:hypothetical protein